jgi:hypothetical protein
MTVDKERQNMSTNSILQRYRGAFVISFMAMLVLPTISTEAQQFETGPSFKASQILPSQLLRGPNHAVDETVRNDGYINRYTIRSKYGVNTGITTAKLRKRIHEINALVLIEKVKGTKVFKDSALEAGGDVWRGMKALVTKPATTLSGAVSGVGKMFSRMNEHLFGSKRSQSEDSRLKALIGFSKAKREYAYEFGVDVYSSNKALQEELNDMAWSGYAGGLSVAGLMSAVPGAAGILVSTTGSARLANELLRTTSPVDLRRMNRRELKNMGVNADIAELFINNDIYTPRQQTLLVKALFELKGVKNRQAFVKFGVLTRDPDVAFFRQRMAQMYAAYHKSIAPIDSFITLGANSPIVGMNFAVVKNGTVLFHAPLDYLAWTEPMANAFTAIDRAASALPGAKRKELWFAGGVSPLARRNIERAGWKIYHNQETRLLPSDWCTAKDVSACDQALKYASQ